MGHDAPRHRVVDCVDARDCSSTPDAAVRAVPPRLLLLCLLLRGSWLMVDGGPQIGATGMLYRRGVGAVVGVAVGVAVGVLTQKLLSRGHGRLDSHARMQESEGHGRRLGSAHARSAW